MGWERRCPFSASRGVSQRRHHLPPAADTAVPHYIHVHKLRLHSLLIFPHLQKNTLTSPALDSSTPSRRLFFFLSKCHSDCHSCSKEMRLVMRLAEGFNASVSLSSLALTSSFSLAHQKLIPVSACNIRPFSGSPLRSVALNSAWGFLQLRADTKTEKWWRLPGFLTCSRATESHQRSLKLSDTSGQRHKVWSILEVSTALPLCWTAPAGRCYTFSMQRGMEASIFLSQRLARGWTRGFAPQM